MRRRLWLVLAVLALGGCASAPVVDRSLNARSQDSRVRYVVLHYTALNLKDSIRELVERGVSSHYLVTDENPPRILGLVDESQRAFHAGLSSWRGVTQLNASSIGIEIVNAGDRRQPDGTLAWAPFDDRQVDLVVELVRDIVRRHGIPPERVLGHSDIAPQRKVDPGPAFPWVRLAQAGLVQWPDPAQVQMTLQDKFGDARVPDVAWFQRKLMVHGFQVPQTGTLDPQTLRVVAAFQMKYRPTRVDGQPDSETAALLAVLTGSAD